MSYKPQTTFTSLSDWIDKPSFKAIFLVLLSGTWLTTATAQVQFPVAQPTPKVGEIAKYRTIDLWNNAELSTSQSELVEVTGERLITRFNTSTNPELRTNNFNRSWNPCRSLRNSDKMVCDGSIKFPLQAGTQYEYKELPWANGNGFTSMKCEVKGEEKLTLSAGAFDTVKVECAGFWTRKFDGSGTGRTSETNWYAPTIARVVKNQYVSLLSSGAPDIKTQTDLVEFIPAK